RDGDDVFPHTTPRRRDPGQRGAAVDQGRVLPADAPHLLDAELGERHHAPLRGEPAGHGVRLRHPGRIPAGLRTLGAAPAGGRGALHVLRGSAVAAAEQPGPAHLLRLRLLGGWRPQLRGLGRRARDRGRQRPDLHGLRSRRAVPLRPAPAGGPLPQSRPAASAGGGRDPQPQVLGRVQLRAGEGAVMRRANGLALAGMLLAATACDDGRLPSELQGRVYDVRLLAEPSPATRIPGGTVAVTAAGDVVSDVTVSAVRLPGGPAAEYSAYLLDERTGNAGARVTFAPDELGEGTVTLSDLGEATTVVIAAGAQAPGALWARFRDLSTGAI